MAQVEREAQRAFKAARSAHLATDMRVREGTVNRGMHGGNWTHSYHKGWQVAQWRGETTRRWDGSDNEMRSSTPTKELVLEKGNIFRTTGKLCIQDYAQGENTYFPTSVESIVEGRIGFNVEDVRMGLARIIVRAGG